MKVLAVVPARLDSVRCERKNLRRIGPRNWPMLWYTLEAACAAKSIAQVVVKTDAKEISDSVLGFGGRLVQPRTLSALVTEENYTHPNAIAAVLEAVEYAGPDDYDAVAMLLPTSPLRTARHIDEAVRACRDVGADRAMVSVTYDRKNPLRRLDLGGLQLMVRSNGAIQVTRPDTLLRERDIPQNGARPYFMDPVSGLDVDTEADLALADRYLHEREGLTERQHGTFVEVAKRTAAFQRAGVRESAAERAIREIREQLRPGGCAI